MKVRCTECKGMRVVSVVDEARLNDEQKKTYAEFQRQEAQRAQWDAEDAATRRAECGVFGAGA